MSTTFEDASESELKRLATLAVHADLTVSDTLNLPSPRFELTTHQAVNWEAAHAAFDPDQKTQLASFKTVSQRALAKFKKAAAAGGTVGSDGEHPKSKTPTSKRKGAAAEDDDNEDGTPAKKKTKAARKPRARKGAKKAAAAAAEEEAGKFYHSFHFISFHFIIACGVADLCSRGVCARSMLLAFAPAGSVDSTETRPSSRALPETTLKYMPSSSTSRSTPSTPLRSTKRFGMSPIYSRTSE